MTEPAEIERQRADLLCRVVGGEVEPDAPEVVAYLARDPEFAGELRELAALDLELRCGPPLPDLAEPAPRTAADAAVAGHVRAALGGPRPAPPTHRRWWPLVVLAAAAVLAFFCWPDRERSATPAGPEQTIGAQGLWPDAAATVTRADLANDGFRWDRVEPRPALARYEVVVRAGERRWSSPPLRELVWRVPAETVAQFPDAITWEVHVSAPGYEPTTWTAHVQFR